MESSSGSNDVSRYEYSQLREELLAFAALEAEDLALWDSKCKDPTCPLRKVVLSEPSEREPLLEQFSDEQVLQLLVKHMNCYEQSHSRFVSR